MQAVDLKTLPPPDPESLAHSAAVDAYIRQHIEKAGGSIGFADFMHDALYAPGLGYYTAGSTKFGDAGDFVTAPEISPIFSRVIARQVAAVFEQMDDPGSRNILEFGAGTGVLAVDALTALRALDSLPQHYFIIEVSPDLQARQSELLREKVPEDFDRVVWLSAIPESFSGVVIANEVLDALPVERFVKKDGLVCRQMVSSCDAGFTWGEEPASDALRDAVTDIEADLDGPLPDGYISEVSLGMPGWIADLSRSLSRGLVLLFDYGVSRREYFAADRYDGWLRCHFRHHAHSDPLVYVGIQDLTSWVDFSAVASASVDAGLAISGYLTQGQFLLNGGLLEEMEDFAGLPTAAQMALSGQIKVLTMPGEMGDHVKCLALSKGDIVTSDSIRAADRAHTL